MIVAVGQIIGKRHNLVELIPLLQVDLEFGRRSRTVPKRRIVAVGNGGGHAREGIGRLAIGDVDQGWIFIFALDAVDPHFLHVYGGIGGVICHIHLQIPCQNRGVEHIDVPGGGGERVILFADDLLVLHLVLACGHRVVVHPAGRSKIGPEVDLVDLIPGAQIHHKRRGRFAAVPVIAEVIVDHAGRNAVCRGHGRALRNHRARFPVRLCIGCKFGDAGILAGAVGGIAEPGQNHLEIPRRCRFDLKIVSRIGLRGDVLFAADTRKRLVVHAGVDVVGVAAAAFIIGRHADLLDFVCCEQVHSQRGRQRVPHVAVGGGGRIAVHREGRHLVGEYLVRIGRLVQRHVDKRRTGGACLCRRETGCSAKEHADGQQQREH